MPIPTTQTHSRSTVNACQDSRLQISILQITTLYRESHVRTTMPNSHVEVRNPPHGINRRINLVNSPPKKKVKVLEDYGRSVVWSVCVYSQYEGLVSSEVRTRPSREIELDLRTLQKLEKRLFQLKEINRKKYLFYFLMNKTFLLLHQLPCPGS